MSEPRRPAPVAFSDAWPDAVIDEHDAETARQFVLNLRAALAGRSVRSVAKDAGIDDKTIRKILAGLSWPDLRSIARLEQATGKALFPRPF